MLKRTALFEEHKKSNGRMVDFGGWELPVQYSGVAAEHAAVRTACGIFDVSHMGEIIVEGPGALDFVNFATTNDAGVLAVYQAQYSALCHPHGGLVDDLVVYRIGEEKFLLVVNASNTEKDFAHLSKVLNSFTGVTPTLRNDSEKYSQIAVQGPKAAQILQTLTDTNLATIKTYWCADGEVAKAPCLIARTGYTGEDGFELYVPWTDGPSVWQALLSAGSEYGLIPCGLGARDTLRLEMKYALYGHELTDETRPLEVGLAWITKLNKKSDFVGKAALQALKSEGLKKALVGLSSDARGIPRQGYTIYATDKETKIGVITSGTQSPSLKRSIAIAFIDKLFETVGTKVFVKVREDFHEFEVVKTPFVNQKLGEEK